MVRTEPVTNNVFEDYRINQDVENLPQLGRTVQAITDRYLEVQQDILETFVNRG